MFKKQLLILFVIIWARNSSCFIDTLFKIVKETWNFGEFLHTSRPSHNWQIASLLGDAVENENIIEFLEDINKKFGYFKIYSRDEYENQPSWVNPSDVIDDIHPNGTELISFMKQTNSIWNTFNAHLKNRSMADVYDKLANEILGSIGYHLGDFRTILDPSPLLTSEPDKGYFMAMALRAHDPYHSSCNHGETFQDTAVRLFQSVILTEIKAHILMSFAYLVKFDKAFGWKTPLTFLKGNFREQFIKYIHLLQKSLRAIDFPYIRRCCPRIQQKDINYYELDGLFQQTIYRKSECSSSHSFSCSDLAAGKGHGYSCSLSAINQHTSCDGKLHDCEDLHGSTSNASVCLWNWGPHRIRFTEYKGKPVGTDIVNPCPDKDYHRFSDMESSNTVCSCQCRSEKLKILLKLMLSRVHQNYVIVGLRIHRTEDYIYIQIAEGKLESNGYIANYSWVPSTRSFHTDWSYDDTIATLGVNNRTFFLDDLQLEPGYVLTGAQFTAWPHGYRPISFSIMGLKFNHETGQLDVKHKSYPARSLQSKPEYVKTDIHEWGRGVGIRLELKFPTKRRPDIGAWHGICEPASTEYTHVKLQQSDLSDDFGQSTLPLFDATEILTRPLLPIGGAGLFYKSYESEAGFLALRLYPLNYSACIDEFQQTYDLTSLTTWNEEKI